MERIERRGGGNVGGLNLNETLQKDSGAAGRENGGAAGVSAPVQSQLAGPSVWSSLAGMLGTGRRMRSRLRTDLLGSCGRKWSSNLSLLAHADDFSFTLHTRLLSVVVTAFPHQSDRLILEVLGKDADGGRSLNLISAIPIGFAPVLSPSLFAMVQASPLCERGGTVRGRKECEYDSVVVATNAVLIIVEQKSQHSA